MGGVAEARPSTETRRRPAFRANQSRPEPRGSSTSRVSRSTSQTPSRSSAVRESARDSGRPSRHASYGIARPAPARSPAPRPGPRGPWAAGGSGDRRRPQVGASLPPRGFAVGFEQRIRQGTARKQPSGTGTLRNSRLAAVSVGVTVLLIGSLAAAQLPSAEQRAFAGVDSAVARFNGASDRNEMVRAAGQVLDAAESALNAFAASRRGGRRSGGRRGPRAPALASGGPRPRRSGTKPGCRPGRDRHRTRRCAGWVPSRRRAASVFEGCRASPCASLR